MYDETIDLIKIWHASGRVSKTLLLIFSTVDKVWLIVVSDGIAGLICQFCTTALGSVAWDSGDCVTVFETDSCCFVIFVRRPNTTSLQINHKTMIKCFCLKNTHFYNKSSFYSLVWAIPTRTHLSYRHDWQELRAGWVTSHFPSAWQVNFSVKSPQVRSLYSKIRLKKPLIIKQQKISEYFFSNLLKISPYSKTKKQNTLQPSHVTTP